MEQEGESRLVPLQGELGELREALEVGEWEQEELCSYVNSKPAEISQLKEEQVVILQQEKEQQSLAPGSKKARWRGYGRSSPTALPSTGGALTSCWGPGSLGGLPVSS